MINATKKFSVIFALFLYFFLVEAKADLPCPASIASDTGNAEMRGLDVRNGTCGVYNLNITSYNSAGSGGFAIASFPFTALLPDTNFPSSARFVMHNGISEVSFSTVTCNGATISSLGTTHVDITLAPETSCELTLAGDFDTIGRVAMHQGQGLGLHHYRLGQRGGSEIETLTVNQIPSHSHSSSISQSVGDSNIPNGTTVLAQGIVSLSRSATADINIYKKANASTDIQSKETNMIGGSQSHNNMQPYLAVNYIIALQGIYPSRS